MQTVSGLFPCAHPFCTVIAITLVMKVTHRKIFPKVANRESETKFASVKGLDLGNYMNLLVLTHA